MIDTARDSSMMGVHFRPGGAPTIVGLPASELSDRIVGLDAIWGSNAQNLRERLIEANEPAAKFKCLENFLLRRTDNRVAENASIAHAIRIFESAAECVSVRKVAAEIGWSHKHLISAFHSRVGMSPKQFSRVRRFQNTVRSLQASQSSALADTALSCGYYDQAHFNSEFKAFSGLTPTDFLRDAAGRTNFIPLRPA